MTTSKQTKQRLAPDDKNNCVKGRKGQLAMAPSLTINLRDKSQNW